MKRMILTGICVTIVCISGCAKSLPPHEQLNQAVKKSFDASGFNYSSKSRITNISIPKQDAKDATGFKKLKSAGAVLGIVRGFSVNIDGALDMKNKKSEALYDLHYDRDNVEISIRLPLLVDYNTQTVYIGPSFLNTFLDIAIPQEAESSGKLIRVNIPELLREEAADSPELSKLLGDNLFSPKKMDVISNAFKATFIKAVAKLDDKNFSDQPLSEQDRKAGVGRRIQVKLGHGDAVALALDLIDGISQALFQEGIISKKEYGVLLMMTDKQKLDEFINKFDMSMTQDIGLAQSGHVSYMLSRLSVSDKGGNYKVGLENVSSFDRYDSPQFSITPEAGRIVDFKEVIEAIKAINTKEQKASPPALEAPDPPAPG